MCQFGDKKCQVNCWGRCFSLLGESEQLGMEKFYPNGAEGKTQETLPENQQNNYITNVELQPFYNLSSIFVLI